MFSHRSCENRIFPGPFLRKYLRLSIAFRRQGLSRRSQKRLWACGKARPGQDLEWEALPHKLPGGDPVVREGEGLGLRPGGHLG